MTRKIGTVSVILLFTAAMLSAQRPDGRRPEPRSLLGDREMQPPASGKWWADSGLSRRIGLSSRQQSKIESLFRQNRTKLRELSAALEREEGLLQPLLGADDPDEGEVLAQIDRIAQARSELDKANARMLLNFRTVLNADQWKKLQAESTPDKND